MNQGPRRDTVIGKVHLILDALAASGGVLGLSELARRSGVAKATVQRLCLELVAWGVVERAGDAFRLGPRLFELGSQVPGRRQLRDAALPFLEDLSAATGHTVHLAVLDGDEVIYVERLPGRASAAVPSAVADRLPLHCTATGRCLLAFGSPELFARVLEEPLEARTPASTTAPAALRAVLDRVRVDGVAVEREEVVTGLLSVGAPVFELGQRLAGAVSITGPVSGLDPEAVTPLVRLAAAGLTRRLGGAPPVGPVPEGAASVH